jgi:hypothetical protein
MKNSQCICLSIQSGVPPVMPRTDRVTSIRRHGAVLSLLTVAAFALAPVNANAQVGPRELSGASCVYSDPSQLGNVRFRCA